MGLKEGRQRRKKKDSCTPETEKRIRINEIIAKEWEGGDIRFFSFVTRLPDITHRRRKRNQKKRKKKKRKQRHEHKEKDSRIYEDKKKGRKNKKKWHFVK